MICTGYQLCCRLLLHLRYQRALQWSFHPLTESRLETEGRSAAACRQRRGAIQEVRKASRNPSRWPVVEASDICFGAVYGRLSVGKGFVSFCSCWLVRPCIRPVGAAFHVPLAIMPFARFRSRSKARTYSARPQWVFLIRRYQPALCISSCPPFPTSLAIPRLVSFYAMTGSL
jgi:hypothetical protein